MLGMIRSARAIHRLSAVAPGVARRTNDAFRGPVSCFRNSTRRHASDNATSAAKNGPAQPDALRAFMNRPRKMFNQDLSPAQLCGRASFLLSLAAFAEPDMFDLRCLALLSSVFSISYQYMARPAPQKIPLHWNALLVAVNTYMASSLYMERKRAEDMGGHAARLYKDGNFEQRGFSRVEFCKLFCYGADVKERILKEGERLTTQGKRNECLYYIVHGTVDVTTGKDNKLIATLPENVFVGEMSFLDVLYNEEENERSTAFANVTAGRGGATVYEWELDDLVQYLRKEHECANALQTLICHDMRYKLKRSNKILARQKTAPHPDCVCDL